ncbi:PTS sugar transporter subunit IIC [Vagococcus salmoninarum]|uniref:Permease IIC component n=1 Tax=Vagococcus salmoninarum TaxID=2739 RepID=A0A429ZT33_9ENTE|nr:PTS transporter subunit EIIC [Vagococcus salmoninarum]MBE9388638.1 PTS sugar transporter subunit IIC [Vagococcus salmoninarum]RST96824.1 PTS sugar transporter subunit IID [Vagococcus salmoninarum]
MEALEKFLNKFLGPVANWMSQSKFFSALSEAFMRTTPVTLGAAILMIIGNFPIPAWVAWVESSGMKVHFDSVIGATMNAISIFIVFNFAYVYARNEKQNPLSSGLLAIASFFILMPQQIAIPTLETAVETFPGQAVVTAMENKEAFDTFFTGGTGLMVAIFVGWLTAWLFVFLNKKNLTVKMPDTVPTNVAESLSPSILSGVIFIVFFLIRLAFAFTPFGSIFYFIFGLIQQPLQALTSSPIAIIIIFTLANLLWFFGIHPNMVYGVVMPMLMANGVANMNAFRNGEPLPFLLMGVIALVCGNGFGGQGGTYGLVIAMFTAKSERYKSLRKLAGPPVIFNVNEPLVFGMPLMLNPVFFIPMAIGPILMGSAAWLMVNILDFTKLNPMISLPWTTPAPIVMALQGGFKYLIIFVVVFIINVVLWFPFFRIADKHAVQEEAEAAATM